MSEAIKTLAGLSLIMWQECHRRGFSASVRCSRTSRATRYLTINKCVVIRLSDHAASDRSDIDYEIIIRDGDDLKKKRRDALSLFEQIVASPTSVAA